MTYKETHRWVDVIKGATRSYNNTYHHIKQSPASVKDEDEVYQWKLQHNTLYEKAIDKKPYAKYKFKAGKEVRVLFLCRAFQKQHDEMWSRKVFSITERSIPQYTLKDYTDTVINENFTRVSYQKLIAMTLFS